MHFFFLFSEVYKRQKKVIMTHHQCWHCTMNSIINKADLSVK